MQQDHVPEGSSWHRCQDQHPYERMQRCLAGTGQGWRKLQRQPEPGSALPQHWASCLGSTKRQWQQQHPQECTSRYAQ